MISIPVAVHNSLFEWQLDLFWFNHQLTYADEAKKKALAIVIKRNSSDEPKHEVLDWPLDIPHRMCESFFDYQGRTEKSDLLATPLNIQIGLKQIIDDFHDDEIIEVLDCDMFHFRRHPPITVVDDALMVCDFYEKWHLKSLTEHSDVIEPYCPRRGVYSNGGFVPIVGTARTIRKILNDWIDFHNDILARPWPNLIKWWAGMYAFQAACEKARVTMVAMDYCYLPNINQITDHHYIAHYCCDVRFDKKRFPNVNVRDFGDNEFYRRLLQWPRLAGGIERERQLESPHRTPNPQVRPPVSGKPSVQRTHMDALRLIANGCCAERYLEISVTKSDNNSDRVECPAMHRIAPGANCADTSESSDAFFSKLEDSPSKTPCYDLVRIDGRCSVEQAKRDICHSLRWCSPEGAVAVQNCWLSRFEQAEPARDGAATTTDVWKALIQIAEENPKLDFRTWPGDDGLCIIRPPVGDLVRLPYRARDYYTEDFYLTHRSRILREVEWRQLWRWFFSG